MGVSSINSFVVSAAIEKAKKIMAEEEALRLSREDAMLFMDALDRPAEPNKKLNEAFSSYKKKTL